MYCLCIYDIYDIYEVTNIFTILFCLKYYQNYIQNHVILNTENIEWAPPSLILVKRNQKFIFVSPSFALFMCNV